MLLRHVTCVLFVVVTATSVRADGPVALLPPSGEGLGADELARIERTLRIEVDRRFGARSIPGDVVHERLDAGSAKGLRCDRTLPACSAQLGIVCGADLVILATFVPKGAAGTLTFSLIDVDDAMQIARASGPVGAEPTPQEIRALLGQLYAPAAGTTRLALRGPPGAQVLVDGIERGQLPLPVIEDLAPGEHHVVVLGALRRDEVVNLRRGERVDIEMPATPTMLPASTEGFEEAGSTSAMPLAILLTGGAVALLGGTGLAIGLAPRVAYNDNAARLREIETQVGNDRQALAARADEVETARANLGQNAEAWSSWGQPLVVAGGITLGFGVLATSVGAVMLAE